MSRHGAATGSNDVINSPPHGGVGVNQTVDGVLHLKILEKRKFHFSHMSRHGRAVMPWGKHKGVQLRLLGDAELSSAFDFLTPTRDGVAHSENRVVDGRKVYCRCDACVEALAKKFDWLKESLLAELRHRGLRTEPESMPVHNPSYFDSEDEARRSRAIRPSRPDEPHSFNAPIIDWEALTNTQPTVFPTCRVCGRRVDSISATIADRSAALLVVAHCHGQTDETMVSCRDIQRGIRTPNQLQNAAWPTGAAFTARPTLPQGGSDIWWQRGGSATTTTSVGSSYTYTRLEADLQAGTRDHSLPAEPQPENQIGFVPENEPSKPADIVPPRPKRHYDL